MPFLELHQLLELKNDWECVEDDNVGIEQKLHSCDLVDDFGKSETWINSMACHMQARWCRICFLSPGSQVVLGLFYRAVAYYQSKMGQV